MISLYHGSGATDFEILRKVLSVQENFSLKRKTIKLLKAYEHDKAAELVSRFDFEIYEGTNYFNDEFEILYSKVPFDTYINLKKEGFSTKFTREFRSIANVICDMGHYIRHIVIDYNVVSESSLVEEPSLKNKSQIVEEALNDAQNLLNTSGAKNAVDRIHTAFHAFLQEVCANGNIEPDKNANITNLLKLIIKQYQIFQDSNDHIKKIIRSISAIVDAVNTTRNQDSLAHPNKLLAEPEAMLIINSVRTLLHYLDSKLNIE